MQENIIEKVEKYVKEKTLGEETGHDWWHIQRVNNNAVLINKVENGNELLVRIIALFHDLYDSKFYQGNVEKKLIETLKTVGIYHLLSENDIYNITYSCENLSYSKNIDEKKNLSIEGMIVQDADRLDALGAIGIARTFAYGGKVKRSIYNPEAKLVEIKTECEYRDLQGDSISHFYEKLLKLKDLMNTEGAKMIANSRHEYMESFLKEFFNEWHGNK